MPYVMDWPPKRILAIAAVGVGLLIAAPAASASNGSCPPPSSSNVFSQFGDSSSYSLVPGGSFEDALTGWSLQAAAVMPINEPWDITDPSDSHSLGIAPSGSAVSPSFCVTNEFPTLRLFARGYRLGWNNPGTLNVSLQWTDNNGNSGQTQIGTLSADDYRSWQPTPSMNLGAQLDDSTTLTGRLVFSASQGAAWTIDDVYVDPYAK